MNKIPFYSLGYVTESIGRDLLSAFGGVLESNWFIRGPRSERFEGVFAKYCGAQFGVGTGNGLDALTLMLRASIELGYLKRGDEVIVPANTFVATVLAVCAAGLVPVLVDPDRETCNLDVSLLEGACSERTRAILAVHLYGRLADMPAICEFAKAKGLLVFEDAAQSHGAELDERLETRDERKVARSTAAAYSFYPTKNLGALGDAGMVVTDDADLARTVRMLGNYGSERTYVTKYVGVKVQAAILLEKLLHLDAWNARRREIAARYCSEIRNPLVRVTPVPANPLSHVWHVFPVFCERRDELQAFLSARGIETLVHYPVPPHLQEAFTGASEPLLRHGALPVAEELARTELSIPMGPGLGDGDVSRVVDALNEFV